MNFALDVTNLRVKSAMEKLGIDPSELVVKALNEFGSKGTRDEIKKLRFDYHVRRLEETVKMIKSTMQPIRPRTKETTIKSAMDDEFFDKTSVPLSANEKKVFLNERNKEVLVTALEEIRDFHQQPLKKKERPKSTANPRDRLKKIDQFKKNQQENLNRIKDREEMKVRKALSQGFNYNLPSNPTPRNKVLSNTIGNHLRFGSAELEIAQKLAKFDEKLEKSKILHEKQILMKKESARTQVSIGKLSSITDENQNELLVRILERSRAVSERREKRKKDLNEKWERVKTFKEQKAKKIDEIDKEFKKAIHNKEISLEKKQIAATKIVKDRKASVGKEIELKLEQQKLKDEEAFIKLRRAHKVM